ncbi:hypothetical protein V6N11_035333 [Hibiscus sabdariffa]|uniref:Uncharacterized protein n=1 Tax=Hibiscus sabdariffa TaxID=183260 RepID=A0ABR2R0F7_9ROSI
MKLSFSPSHYLESNFTGDTPKSYEKAIEPSWVFATVHLSSGFELMGVTGVVSNRLWNRIDFWGAGVFDEGANENDEGGELSML